ncbi:hypothetical protein KCP91_12130 [Microvirga sp. SRT01]|uniref:Uncharacterized protein n=1 Tax=Sphingomonas longa TaxID=2778730 RepID=A0ABS2D867_9SPHN|nr:MULTISPECIES: hypothetical protein [Alphaproteobacteria]MBM6577121.1 hypothetical protein [Sphingomonas sp. BT552]MBR7710165.1 hypothetical protein [Microvirga sp. SRT01]
MSRPLNEIADDLDALHDTMWLAATEMDRVIRQQRGEETVMDKPGAKMEFRSEDGRPLDLKAMANELRAHVRDVDGGTY